jgi:hypothetical protein
VSEYGFGQYSAGFGRQPAPPPPPQPDPGSSRPFLFFLLIIACAALGVLLAWGIREHGERARLSVRNHEVEDAYVAVLAKRNDLADFLTDQRTRLYRLVGHNEANGHAITVAWQEQTNTGMLVGDRVPPLADHTSYVLWRLNALREALRCGDFHPDPAGTYLRFPTTPAERAPEPANTSGFLVSVESDPSPSAPGRIVYQTQ